jgi:hypothetical protein
VRSRSRGDRNRVLPRHPASLQRRPQRQDVPAAQRFHAPRLSPGSCLQAPRAAPLVRHTTRHTLDHAARRCLPPFWAGVSHIRFEARTNPNRSRNKHSKYRPDSRFVRQYAIPLPFWGVRKFRARVLRISLQRSWPHPYFGASVPDLADTSRSSGLPRTKRSRSDWRRVRVLPNSCLR